MIRARLSELEIDDLGEGIWEELYPRAIAAAEKGAAVIVARAKQNLGRPGTPQTAAKPGDPPERDSGRLQESIKVFGTKRTKYSVRAEYGSNHPGAINHEFGGTTRGEVKRTYPPRPYMRPAEETTRAEVLQILDNL